MGSTCKMAQKPKAHIPFGERSNVKHMPWSRRCGWMKRQAGVGKNSKTLGISQAQKLPFCPHTPGCTDADHLQFLTQANPSPASRLLHVLTTFYSTLRPQLIWNSLWEAFFLPANSFSLNFYLYFYVCGRLVTCFLTLEKWCSVEDVLWVPAVHTPLATQGPGTTWF